MPVVLVITTSAVITPVTVITSTVTALVSVLLLLILQLVLLLLLLLLFFTRLCDLIFYRFFNKLKETDFLPEKAVPKKEIKENNHTRSNSKKKNDCKLDSTENFCEDSFQDLFDT